ncbi:hypothetical protein KOM00_15315 [Geomonas sp. Red69]|uniref:HEPN AbiU2-like domain-containing protein n=1 Tax=Geomonas diazotrophica TaxID=2843197 RepID=A0ABX8JCU6_9BACT|nr:MULTISPECIES: hypothetical protein [Geomonas]MBU5638099.1 hypothetical protein [Geomonas diazotrophica]QWV95826.1 hypothetical protein KP005_10505 [Geomonas nitrogeniifigens]
MYVEFELPAIPEHASDFAQYWLKSLFIQFPSNRYQINALTSTYVRLVEAAIIEYQLGAIKLGEFWGTHSSFNVGAMHRSVSHFETCISNMYRATNCFRRLRRDKNPLSQMLNAEKANFATDSIADRFRMIRNEIHHLEELVMKEQIADGQPFALKPDGPETPHPTEPNQTIKTIDRLVIGTREVRFGELTEWLSEMANFAVKIADFLPSS